MRESRSIRWPAGLALLGPPRGFVAPYRDGPIQLKREEAQKRLMDLLHTRPLRQGANHGHPQAPNWPAFPRFAGRYFEESSR